MKKVLEYASYIFGILGVILSIYFYQVSIKQKDPTFIIEPIRTQIINSKKLNNQPIKVIAVSDGQEIKKDLTVIRFYFWNKGKEAIKAEDVLKPLQIVSDSEVKILYAKEIKTSRELCEIKQTIIDSSKILLNFKILEKNDGLTGEFLYEGPTNANFKLNGAIESVSQFSHFSVSTSFLIGKTLFYFFLGLFGIYLFIILSGSQDIRPDYVRMKEDPKYKTDLQFKNHVDMVEKKASELNIVRKSLYKEPLENSELKKNRKIKIIIIWAAIIILIGAIIFTLHQTKIEIENSPKNYIPASINPN